MTDPMIGKVIRGYKIIKLLGSGGMGSVYKAEHTEIGNILAIKVLGLGREISDKERTRFFNEAKALAALRHTNILKVLDFVSEEGIYYIFMEYVEGKTLQDLLNNTNGPLPIPKAIKLVAQIARALDYAHNKKVIHRDIKPSNILITEDDQAVLTDFGIAKLAEATTVVDITRDGATVGTPNYMSPEQASAKNVGGHSDVYSLGVVLYRMITGQVPFSGSPMEVISQHVSKSPPSPMELNHKLTAKQEKIILKALEKKTDKRYQRAGQLANDFLSTLTGTSEIEITQRSWRERVLESPIWGKVLQVVRVFQSGVFRMLAFLIRLILSILSGIIIVTAVLVILASWFLGITLENSVQDYLWEFDKMGIGHQVEYTFEDLSRTFDSRVANVFPAAFSELAVRYSPTTETAFYVETNMGKRNLSLDVSVEIDEGYPVFKFESLNDYPLPGIGYMISNGINKGFEEALSGANATVDSVIVDRLRENFVIIIDGSAPQTAIVDTTICKDGVAFIDDFTDPYSGWKQSYETSQASVGYSGGMYSLKTFVSNIVLTQTLSCKYKTFDIHVDTEIAGNIEDTLWGIVFLQKDYDNYWGYQVNALGWYSVEKVAEGNRTLIVPWAESEAISSVGKNSLAISVDPDGNGKIWINDVELTVFSISEDEIPESGGSVGFLLRSGLKPEVEVLFDNFQVDVEN